MSGRMGGIFRFYVSRLTLLYASTGLANALLIDGWLYVLTSYASLPLFLSTLVAVVTSIFTDFTWKSKVVFHTPLASRERFGKYFLNAAVATAIQYALTITLSAVVHYLVAYLVSVAAGFLFAYTVSRLKIWNISALPPASKA